MDLIQSNDIANSRKTIVSYVCISITLLLSFNVVNGAHDGPGALSLVFPITRLNREVHDRKNNDLLTHPIEKQDITNLIDKLERIQRTWKTTERRSDEITPFIRRITDPRKGLYLEETILPIGMDDENKQVGDIHNQWFEDDFSENHDGYSIMEKTSYVGVVGRSSSGRKEDLGGRTDDETNNIKMKTDGLEANYFDSIEPKEVYDEVLDDSDFDEGMRLANGLLSDGSYQDGHTLSRIKRQADNNEALWNLNIYTYSCRDKCGVEEYLPCSCGASCVVYGNCCDDFEQECPIIAKGARERYRDFLNAEIMCTDYNVLLITSCRGNSSAYISSSVGDYNTLPELIYNISPIYDLHTNLIFINRSIFLCNQYNQSEGVAWGRLRISMPSHFEDEVVKNNRMNIRFVSNQLMNENMKFTFVPYEDGRYGQNSCVHYISHSCPKDFVSSIPEDPTKELCKNLTSYLKCYEELYPNIYCMRCSSIFNDPSTCKHLHSLPSQRSQGWGFSLLAQLDNDDLVMETEKSTKAIHNFNFIKCSTVGDGECDVIDCSSNPDFTDQYSGCSSTTFTSIQVKTEYNPVTDLTDMLGRYLRCKLDEWNVRVYSSLQSDFNSVENMYEHVLTIVRYSTKSWEMINYSTQNLYINTVESAISKYLLYVQSADTFEDKEVYFCSITSSKQMPISCQSHNSTTPKVDNELGFVADANYGGDECLKMIHNSGNYLTAKEIGFPLPFTAGILAMKFSGFAQ